MSVHVVVMHCPFCGEEDLRPNETVHGAWECRGCARVFSVKLVGLLNKGAAHAHD
jgi:transposase-like protein